MVKKRPGAPKFINKNDTSFQDIHGTCETIYRQLHQEGAGTAVCHAAIISGEEEVRLWSTGVLSANLKCLQSAVFFYIGEVFCIRGEEGLDHQFVQSSDPNCYTYTEHGSKNRPGGLQHLNVGNKQVPCYAVPESTSQFLVLSLDRYLTKLPSYAFENNILYLCPKATVPADADQSWYDCALVGRNTLSSMVKEILRATGATIFNACAPEKIMQKTMDHRSLSALHRYERIISEQHHAASRTMMAQGKTTFV